MKYTHTRQQRTPENTEMWTALVSHGVSNTTVKYFKAQWDVTVNNCLAGEDMYSRTEVTTSRMNLLHLFWEQAKSLPHPENWGTRFFRNAVAYLPTLHGVTIAIPRTSKMATIFISELTTIILFRLTLLKHTATVSRQACSKGGGRTCYTVAINSSAPWRRLLRKGVHECRVSGRRGYLTVYVWFFF